MSRSLGLAALGLSAALGLGVVAQPRAAAAAEQVSPEVIAGVVTAIDRDQKLVTVQSSDGQTHQFQAPPETLKDLKVGDRLEAKRRPEKN